MRLDRHATAFVSALATGCFNPTRFAPADTDATGPVSTGPVAVSSVGSSDASDSTMGAITAGQPTSGGGSGSSESSGGLPVDVNIAFVMSQRVAPSDLGGLEGADELCAAAASEAGLPPNTYLAWLSSSTVNAGDASRIGSGARGWIRTDARAFADRLSDLLGPAGSTWYPLRYNEFGVDTPSFVLTATGADGMTLGGTCLDWTANDGSSLSGGASHHVGVSWTAGAGLGLADPCDVRRPLYCLGVDHAAPVAPTPGSGRIAFLSSNTFAPGGGLAAADAACQGDASANGLAGTFLALLATDDDAAVDRFALAGEGWVRPDGVWWFEDPSELAAGQPLSGLMVEADGLTYHGFSPGVWTGAATPAEVGAGATCSSWTSSAPQDSATWGSSSTTNDGFFGLGISLGSCSSSDFRLYCLQE